MIGTSALKTFSLSLEEETDGSETLSPDTAEAFDIPDNASRAFPASIPPYSSSDAFFTAVYLSFKPSIRPSPQFSPSSRALRDGE